MIITNWVGADLANISNEAAIYAAREGDDKVEWKHLNYALERVTSGFLIVFN